MPSVRSLFLAALDMAVPSERARFLDGACAGDARLRAEVESLLAVEHGARADFMATPAIQLNAQALDGEFARGLDAEPAAEGVGARVGRYTLIEKLGEGGMGTVYLAEQHEPVRRVVALKIIKTGLQSAQVVARFEAERQALAMMDHPNIAKVFDAGTTPSGRPYFVMERVAGVPITRFCSERNLPLRERLELFVDACRAIQHAHQKGVIHRDIKPSNILVATADGKPIVKVIDFGIAKAVDANAGKTKLGDAPVLTQLGTLIGTLEYMSPEQAGLNESGVDTRSDVYSLGVLLYELLTGSPPLDRNRVKATALLELLRVIREEDAPPPSTRIASTATLAEGRKPDLAKLKRQVRGELDWIALKALDKDRARRYASAQELARDIDRFLKDEPVDACPPSGWYRLRKLVTRHKWPFVAAGSVAAALVLGFGVAAYLYVQERAAHAAAVLAAQEQARLRTAAEAARRESDRSRVDAENARARAQTAQANAEASELKTRSEAEKNKKIAQFIEDMLRGVAPSVQAGRDTALLRDLLDKTSQRIDKELGAQPEVRARLLAIMAGTYASIGDIAKSRTLYEAAIAAWRSLDGDHSEELVHLHYSLSRTLQDTDLRAAQAFMRKALLIGKNAPNIGDRFLTIVLDDLAHQTEALGEADEAEALLREELQLARRLDESSYSRLSVAISSLWRFLHKRGKTADADDVYREAVALRKTIENRNDPQLAYALGFLANIAVERGDKDEVLELDAKALEFMRKLNGNQHSHTNQWILSLADAKMTYGFPDEALALYREALSNMSSVVVGPNQEKVVPYADALCGALQRRSKQLLDAKQPAEAEALLRECLGVREKHQPNRWETAAARCQLGACLLDEKKYTDAEEPLLKGYQELKADQKQIPPQQLSLLKQTAARLAALYDATNQPQKAAEWRAK